MSVSTLLNKNNFKVYVNEINLKNLNLSSQGNYKLILPEEPPIGAPLSVLAVDNIDNDIITLKFLSPSESLPFDTINCRILNASEEVNSAGIMTSISLDTRNMIIRSDDALSTNNLKTSDTQGSNLTYTLPENSPSQDGEILSSQTNGTMSWIPTNNFIPQSFLDTRQDIELNQTTPNLDVYFPFNLQQGEYYTAILGARVIKTNPTGSISFRGYATNTASTNVNLKPFIVQPNNNYQTYNSSSFDGGLNLPFWFEATGTGNNIIRVVLESDISAGGILIIQNLSMFITRAFI